MPKTAIARFTLIAVGAFALFHVYTSFFGTFEPLIQRSIFISGGMALAFLMAIQGKWRGADLANAALALVALYCGLHVVVHADRLMDVMEDLTWFDKVIATVTILLVLETTRQSVGWSLPIMAVIGIVYYFVGDRLISGDWQPPPVSSETALRTLAVQTIGIYGYLADTGTRVIAIYVIYGCVLMATGGGDVFMKAATLVAGRSYGGAAKVAVVSSALFGMISGSAVANVMAVGTMTIPTMIRKGFPKPFAAGVEATASSGGQIMPPIMGAGAFIMAEWLNIPYADIALAATIPALLYFFSIFACVDAMARLTGLTPTPRAELPSVREIVTASEAIPTFGSMFVLGGFLFADYTPTVAGAAATMALLVLLAITRLLACISNGSKLQAEIVRLGREIVAGIEDSGRNLVVIAVLLGSAGLVVAVLSASGVAVKFSTMLTSFAGISLIWLLILTAILCILLGMDLPTTASYVLAAAVVAGALGGLGLPLLTAHLFIFYFAILSAITPPVCSSVFAAATIANSNFWSVSWQALRVGAAAYFIPFMFVYRPSLLMTGDVLQIVYDTFVSGLSIFTMSGGLMGYYFGRASWPMRIVLLVVSAVLFYPTLWADALGIAAAAAIALVQIALARRRAVLVPQPGVNPPRTAG